MSLSRQWSSSSRYRMSVGVRAPTGRRPDRTAGAGPSPGARPVGGAPGRCHRRRRGRHGRPPPRPASRYRTALGPRPSRPAAGGRAPAVAPTARIVWRTSVLRGRAGADRDRHLPGSVGIQHRELTGLRVLDGLVPAPRPSVTVSSVSTTRLVARYRAGPSVRWRTAPGRRSRRSSLSARNAAPIEVEEPEPGGGQALGDDLGEALHDPIAERGVGVALLPKAAGIDHDEVRALQDVDVVHPAMRREDPRPSDDVSRLQRLDHERARGRGNLQATPARTTKNRPPDRPRANGAPGSMTSSRPQPAIRSRSPGSRPARTGCEASSSRIVGVLIRCCASIAATSSVRSMPAGHHEMQRPHPTQPDSPNWSHHVESLCVSHCR